MVSVYRDIQVNRDEFYPGFICSKKSAFYKELKARETVQNGGRKVNFLLIVHVILNSACYLSYIGFCFLVQCISKHKVTFLSPFWLLQMLSQGSRCHFELLIACEVQSILSRLIGISRLFTFIWTRIHPALPGSRLL